jgi:hypothetical protein
VAAEADFHAPGEAIGRWRRLVDFSLIEWRTHVSDSESLRSNREQRDCFITILLAAASKGTTSTATNSICNLSITDYDNNDDDNNDNSSNTDYSAKDAYFESAWPGASLCAVCRTRCGEGTGVAT